MGSTLEDAHRAALAAGQPRLLTTAHGCHESGEACYIHPPISDLQLEQRPPRRTKWRPQTRAAPEGTFGALSTQPNFTPQWKEEVNRRLAAHKNRKTSTTDSETSSQTSSPAASRAAEAAARVAARYAKAPSYSQLQAEEARVAVRHAEIATKVALEAQAAAESALAGLHAAAQEQPSRGPAVVQPIAPPGALGANSRTGSSAGSAAGSSGAGPEAQWSRLPPHPRFRPTLKRSASRSAFAGTPICPCDRSSGRRRRLPDGRRKNLNCRLKTGGVRPRRPRICATTLSKSQKPRPDMRTSLNSRAN